MLNPPFEVGQSYLVCTVTLYYVGRVKARGPGWLLFERASWVHWTGRLSVLLKSKKFSGHTRKPRVEPCGEVGLATAAIVSWYPWPEGELPTSPVE